jgi:hydroxylamine reductase
MFCYQCQETLRNTGCTVRGVCGKTDTVAAIQDVLVHMLKGIAFYGVKARTYNIPHDDTSRFLLQSLFVTVTNVNFDEDRLVTIVNEAQRRRDTLRDTVTAHTPDLGPLPDAATWTCDGSKDAIVAKAATMSISNPTVDEDIASLRELVIYGLKGLSSYADHAAILNRTDEAIGAFAEEALAATLDESKTLQEMIDLTMQCGSMGVRVMALLDDAHTSTYGHPEPTNVSIGVDESKPGILISGHDLLDLEELLEQTAGKGINVYTHGEMLPAHGYPAFKKYPHLVGNYGGAWWNQQKEFEAFNGPIVMTTNCIQKPLESYQDRIYSTGHVGWPGVEHIANRHNGSAKDFSAVIEQALTCQPPTPLETGTIPVGFAHASVSSVADQVVAAVQQGAIKRFVVMAGCDGRHASRSYYTDVAKGLPEDSIILTAGCAKYRYNKLNLGTIGGFPRVLDAGQCNDSYSLVVIAQKLAAAVGTEDINDLPISYDIAWYEQKAVLVLLALLSLGVKHIRLGPTLPAFLSPNVVDFLVQTFDLKPIDTVEADLAAIAAGA